MKKTMFISALIYQAICLTEAGQAKHAKLLNPKEEEAYFKRLLLEERLGSQKVEFDFTLWDECTRPMTGNYVQISCARNRRIGLLLKNYLEEQLKNCLVDVGNKRGIVVEDFHIEHVGIIADRNHSPRSLHSLGRAIDVKEIRLLLPSGERRTLNYFKDGRGSFFTELRSCWGKAVHEYNSCPVIGGRYDRTASIGKEDGNHQYHLHVSVPYCVGGRYSGNYFRK